MNLNSNPTRNELTILLSTCDDNEAHYMLWVNHQGEVNISPVPNELTPVGFEQSLPDIKMRYETFELGNEITGSNAANDENWVSELFSSLISEWASNSSESGVKYVDFF